VSKLCPRDTLSSGLLMKICYFLRGVPKIILIDNVITVKDRSQSVWCRRIWLSLFICSSSGMVTPRVLLEHLAIWTYLYMELCNNSGYTYHTYRSL